MIDSDEDATGSRSDVWQGRVLVMAVLILVALTIYGLTFVHSDVPAGG